MGFIMVKVNAQYAKLPGNYLFSEIARPRKSISKIFHLTGCGIIMVWK